MVQPHEYFKLPTAIEIYSKFKEKEDNEKEDNKDPLIPERSLIGINFEINEYLTEETHYKLEREGWKWTRKGFEKNGHPIPSGEYNKNLISIVRTFERKIQENPKEELFSSLKKWFE